jgi:tRNA-specific 2-thiouridylase
VVGQKEALKSKVLTANKVNFLVKDFPEQVLAKIRYAHKEALCSIRQENKRMLVIFEEAQEAITPGQSVVFYHGDTVLGGGIIYNTD